MLLAATACSPAAATPATSLQVIKAALELEPELLQHVHPVKRRLAGAGQLDGAAAEVAAVLDEMRPWELVKQLRPVFSKWVAGQVGGGAGVLLAVCTAAAAAVVCCAIESSPSAAWPAPAGLLLGD